MIFHSQGGLSGSLVGSEDSNTIRVKAFRLKEILNKRIDFLKIDIEGAEYDVINDCKEELKNVKNLFIEYHSFADQKQMLYEILGTINQAGFRYHIHEAVSPSPSPSPYLQIESIQNMDLQLNIFAYR